MPAPVEFTLTMSALPVDFVGTPQDLADAIAARLTITPSEPWSSFINGGAEPTSDVGPWLKLGQEWRVWDVGLGAYTYLVVNGAGIAAGSIPSAAFAPGAVDATALADRSVSLAKLAAGTAKGVLTYDGAGAPTVTAAGSDGEVLMQTASGPQMQPLPTGTPFSAYVGTAILNAGQLIPVDTAAHIMTLDTALINGAGAIDLGSSRYVAPAAGSYHIDVTTQFDNATGSAAGMEIVIAVYKNGTPASDGSGDIDGTPSPNGLRWSPNFGGIVSLAQNDYVEIWATLDDGVNSGGVTLTTWKLNVFRISA